MFGVSWRREGETRWLRRTLVMRAVGRPQDTSLAQRNGVQRQLISITTQWGGKSGREEPKKGKEKKKGWMGMWCREMEDERESEEKV